MKKLFVIALAAFGMVACVNEEITELPQGDAIAFESAFIDNATRAAAEDPSTTTATLSGFNVWGFVKEYDGTIFDAVEVKKVGGVWGYEGTQYWVPNQPYYFAALAPINGNWSVAKAIENAAKDGLGTITFTNVDGSEDLLYAKEMITSKGLNEPNGAVKFQFQHLLSKVKFTFKNGFPTNTASVKVTNVKMTAPKKANIDLAVADYSKGWGGYTDVVPLAFGDVEKLAYTQSAEVANERLTIPATTSQTYTITFDVELFMGAQSVYTVSKTSTVTGFELEMGKAYNFTAEITPENLELEEVVFDVHAVEGWDPTSANDYGFDIINNTVSVNTANGLLAVVEGLDKGIFGENPVVVLNNDIDLSTLVQTRAISYNWTPIGLENAFTGTFDGKGHTIKNFEYTVTGEDEAWYVGLFGNAKNATIKNLVMENVTITCEKADFLEVGAVVGHLEGTSTLENITIKGDVKIGGDVNNNNVGRIAAVVGGNYGKFTLKNVHVNVNEGSYVKGNSSVGGIAGQLQGVVAMENCSSNIDVVGGRFFAGGIIGLTATNSTFTNCHTTGDVTLTAATGANNPYRVGGIVGGWDDNTSTPLVLSNCSYSGVITSNGVETLDCQGYVGRGYSAVVGAQFIVNGNVYEYVGAGEYKLLQAAVSNYEELAAALANNISSIVVAEDFAVENAVTVPAGANVVINLNGKTISGTDNATVSYGLITNKGELTINGGGKLQLEATNNRGWNAFSSVISNTVGGNLTVEGGVVIEHLGGTDMAYGIDNLTNGKGTSAVATIKDATVKSPYRAVRQFLNGIEATNELYVENGAVIEGANKSIWMQDPSKNANTGKLVVEAGAQLKGDVYLFVCAGSTKWPVEVSIAEAALVGESTVVTGNVPVGYAVVVEDGCYVVTDEVVTTSEALSTAISGAQSGDVVTVGAGTYASLSGVKAGVTINCLEGVVFEGTSSLNAEGATVIGATFRNEGGQAVSGTINGTFKNCTFDGEETLRWCYTTAGTTVVFENCVVKTTKRGFHFDGMDGNVIFKNCEINGFNAYSGAGTITFEGCVFGNDQANYNGLNIYSNTILKDCQFVYVSGKTNFIDMEGTGKTLTIQNCTATLDGVAAEVSDFVGGSKLAENTVIYE